ncbi:MFS transporter [Demequina zhanjiangensis]|uniref:MFS transporter n=1 Tax=Demequina zhanjiangensis TaxID=3051659 RepID=A0ABT8G1P2_9MICO|nr:MFS transporter [Demequina sp. SYSU T00b26]MDN4473053.1 MFS transporter [Demequina sp. SYSU T00b26]
MKSRTKKDDPDYLPARKLLGWAGAGMSAAANFIVLGYMGIYATDTLGISAAMVGTMILVSSLANVGGGLIASWIVDRSPETRWGKARPYEFAVIGVWIATWALFSTPAGLSQTGRTAWVFVTFLAINVLFDTLLRSNDTLYMARAFANRRVYAKVYTRAGIFTTIMGIIMTVALPIGLNWADKDPGRWSIVMFAVALPLAILGMTRFIFVKEEYRSSDADAPPVTLKDLLATLRAGKWIWLIAGLFLLNSSINGANMIAYYFRYIVGNLGMQGVVSGAAVLILPLILFFPKLMKRFAISQIIITGCTIGLGGTAMYYFADGSIPMLMAGAILIGFASLPLSYLGGVMILDVCSFNEWKGKRRLESTMGAVTGVMGRVGIGLAGLFVGQVLTASGYDGTAEVQTAGAEQAITVLFAGIPAAVFIGIIILMAFYLRFELKILPTVESDLEARRAEAASTSTADPELLPLAAATTEPGEAIAPPHKH